MTKDRSALLKRFTKTLAVGVPVVALSGFVPGIDGVSMNSAQAEGNYSKEYKSGKKASSEAEAKYSSEAKGEAKGKAEAKAEAEGKPEAEAEGYR